MRIALLLPIGLAACAAPKPQIVTVHEVVTRTVYVRAPTRTVYVHDKPAPARHRLAEVAARSRPAEYALAANPATSNAELDKLERLDAETKNALAPLQQPGHVATSAEIANAMRVIGALEDYLATTHPGHKP